MTRRRFCRWVGLLVKLIEQKTIDVNNQYDVNKIKYEISCVNTKRTTIVMPTVIDTVNELPKLPHSSLPYQSKKQSGFPIQTKSMSELLPATSYAINPKPSVFDPSLDLNDIFAYVS
jgi:hypothetical protein